ncbi:hypothetical protein Tco_1110126 [Tanacetum coccineum]|uniref:Uncharacterized protein n=1 Tax=Tanacetum coccineum TaxID=301880 RepID=A0ABQ5IKE9_9ASTR
MSIFSAIPTGYWNDLSAYITLILVGLRVSRDNLAYSKYGIRLMLEPRSAKTLQEKVLLKLHGIRKLPGSPSLGGTLFWIIAKLSSLKKAALIYCDHDSFRAFPSYEAKLRLEIRFRVERKLGFLRGVGQKELGKETANESGSNFIPCFNSSFVEFIQPCFCFPNFEEFVNVFMRIGFDSTIELVSLTRVKWLPLIANSFTVSRIVIAEPGVGATTWLAAHMGSSSIGL